MISSVIFVAESSAPLAFFLILALLVDKGSGEITCYVCPHENNLNICDPLELWGNRTVCPKGVKVCYKSWSVEADPVTVRRCGTTKDEPDEKGQCKERLLGQNKVIACKCDTPLCNDADGNAKPAAAILASLAAASVIAAMSTRRFVRL